MKVLFVHAHFDDYEFTASGTFELWRRKLAGAFRAKVLICTDGQAGHHFRTREETGRLRLEEQAASARIGGYEAELLRLPGGRPLREACQQVTPDLLAALWKAIRDFEPDYLFCPPLGSDPLAGIHNDHETVAEAVRRVAYMINVPHAFTPEYPADETQSKPCKVPVIVNVYDGYMFGANAYDVAVDVEEAFQKICEMTWCHQSQIVEWLPWVGRHNMAPPKSLAEWSKTLRARFDRKNRELGIATSHAVEVFRVTAWGEVPGLEPLVADFPPLMKEASSLDRLKVRLKQWSGQ
jgi:LmbE family N-acetylglucosaminyl deacetylase